MAKKKQREKLPIQYASDLNLRCRWRPDGQYCGLPAVAFLPGMDLCEQHRQPGAIRYKTKPKIEEVAA